MDVFKIKKGDLNPALSVEFQFNDGSAVPLTGGSIWFSMANLNFTPYYSGLAVITDAANGKAEYRWTGSIDTASAGTYWSDFKILWTGSAMTLPSDNSLQVKVYEDYE